MYLAVLELTALAALVVAAPNALSATGPFKTASVLPRTSSTSCNSPGMLFCNSSSQWGLCTAAKTIIWQATAEGTSCLCSTGDCTIVAAESEQSTGTTTANKPVKTHQSTSAASSTKSADKPAKTHHQTSTASSHHATTQQPSVQTSSTSSAATPTGTATIPSNSSDYTTFNGDGSTQDGWPAISAWLSFEDLFKANSWIGTTCDVSFGVPNNSPSDTQALREGILKQATAVGVPPEFALAIVLQESLGCVFVQTTAAAVSNPGLMQDHDGSASCAGKSSCPVSEINGMLLQGLNGTSSGAGINQCHQQAPGSESAQKWYQAARIYNGGSIPAGGDLTGSSAGTSCYSSDVANRLIGWSQGLSGCGS